MFSEDLKSLREEAGLTLREVEKETGLSNSYLSQLENGKRGVPPVRVLRILASFYGLELIDLLEE